MVSTTHPGKKQKDVPEFKYDIAQSISTRAFLATSFVVPFAYTGYTIVRRKPWSIQELLRTTWQVALGDVSVSEASGWPDAASRHPPKMLRHTSQSFNARERRLEVYTLLGGFMGMMLTPVMLLPAIFLRRAKIKDASFGGGCIGSSLGGLMHWWYPMEPLSPRQGKAAKGL